MAAHVGRCVECDEPAVLLCVGCATRKAFVCEAHGRPCVWCESEGPFCSDCVRCAACGSGVPGDWRCGGCAEPLPHDGFRKRCVDCGDRWRCLRCVSVCDCGRGPTHYVCREEWHVCGAQDTGCRRSTCSQYGKVALAVGSADVCCDHRSAVKKRQRELADDQSAEPSVEL